MGKKYFNFKIYTATFLIAFSTLAIEVALTRLLSVITFYYLAFFSVSTAMLGMTAGAVTVYLRPQSYDRERLYGSITKACLAFSLSVPVATVIICLIPLSFGISIMYALADIIVTVSCALPFYFSGIVISAVLTRVDLPVNKLYGSDLIGAAFGCLFVLGGLEILDPQSLIIFTGVFPIIAALLYGKSTLTKTKLRLNYILFAVLILASFINFFTFNGIKPLVVKGLFENTNQFLIEKWNSYSRIVVKKEEVSSPQWWSASVTAPESLKSVQHYMNIDGLAGTVMRKYAVTGDIDHLKYDVTNIAYYLKSDTSACIIGVGGGRDVQSAILFGYTNITGIDVNPIFINLLEHRFRDFAGIAGRKGISLVVDEARSYLNRNPEKYDLIQMSLIDTWASTGAGAYSLSENALYTAEAWKVYINRLNDDGIFTLSRWFDPANLGETGRVVSLAVATLLDLGIKDPSKQIVMVTNGLISTLIINKQPFSDTELLKLKNAADTLKFNIAVTPGEKPKNAILEKIISASSREELSENIADLPLNYEPPSDENPYFFNMLKISSIPKLKGLSDGVISGNLKATRTLLSLIGILGLLTVVTIVIPLLSGTYKKTTGIINKRIFISGAVYFSLIGVGFMLVEIALIQRLSVYLGHPIYALGILLFTVILSTGLGSLISEKIPLTEKPLVYIYPLFAAVMLLLLRFTLSAVISASITSEMIVKILISIAVIFPVGFILGFFFPAGMKLMKDKMSFGTPWFWALNGIFGVMSSAVAILISIYAGISVNFYIAVICYGLLLLLMKNLSEKTA